MNQMIQEIEGPFLKTDVPHFRPGDTVRVSVRIVESGKERNQDYQGVVIGRKGSGLRETFTVRRVSYGVGMERTFQLHSPRIDGIKVIRRAKVRRAKLYYLRKLRGKKARLTERRVSQEKLANEAAADQKALKNQIAAFEEAQAALKEQEAAAAPAATEEQPSAEQEAPQATDEEKKEE